MNWRQLGSEASHITQWSSTCGLWISSSSTAWELIRDANSQAPSRPSETETQAVGRTVICVLIKPVDFDSYSSFRITGLVQSQSLNFLKGIDVGMGWGVCRVEEDVEKEEGRQNVHPGMKSNRGTFSASGTDINMSTFNCFI